MMQSIFGNEQNEQQQNIQKISLNIDLKKVTEQQKRKQEFLEKIIMESEAEYAQLNEKTGNLKINDDKLQQYNSHFRSFLDFLNLELKHAKSSQENKNLLQIDKARLSLEILENYIEFIQLKKEKIIHDLNEQNKMFIIQNKKIQQDLIKMNRRRKFSILKKFAFIVILLSCFQILYHDQHEQKQLLNGQREEVRQLKLQNENLNREQDQQNLEISQIKSLKDSNLQFSMQLQTQFKFLEEQQSEIEKLKQANLDFQQQLDSYTLIIQIKEQELFTFKEEVSYLLKQVSQQTILAQELKKNQDFLIEQWAKNEKERNKFNHLAGEIFQNMNTDFLKDFTVIYNKYYTQPFSKIIFQKLSNQLFQNGKDPLVCVGSVKVNNQNQLILVGCDFASEVFQLTFSSSTARQSKNGPIFWYWVNNKSFGFAPTKEIKLNSCDQHDQNNNLRFSYWVDGKLGGRRIGRLQNIIDSEQYKLVIYALID